MNAQHVAPAVAQTLMLTTKCSPRCCHCPFGKAEMPSRHLSFEKAADILGSTQAPLIVLSGGEPLEYPNLKDLLLFLTDRSHTPFRLATGGFIDLHPWLSLLRSNRAFQGISLGTDVVLGCGMSSSHVQSWWRNLSLLRKTRIRYSLTITVTDQSNWHSALLLASSVLDSRLEDGNDPEFIYLRWFWAGATVSAPEAVRIVSERFTLPVILDHA